MLTVSSVSALKVVAAGGGQTQGNPYVSSLAVIDFSRCLDRSAGLRRAVPLTDGESLTVSSGGVSATFTVSNCTNTAACGGASQMVQDPGQLGVLIESATSGANLLDAPKVDIVSDLTFDLSVSATASISGMTLGMTGSGDQTSVGEIFSNGTPAISVFVGGPLSATAAFAAPTASFSVAKDLGAYYIFSGPAYITEITQDLVVPEPASAGLLLSSIGGLVALRRRRRQSA